MASTAPPAATITSSSPSLPHNQPIGASLPPPLTAAPSSAGTTTTPPVGAQVRADTTYHNGHAYPTPASASPQLDGSAVVDARVRNPVPSKLKGKVDGRNGNFIVMHMGLARPEMNERDLAAKRSSEGTEAAARLASQEGYRPVKRTQLAWLPQSTQPYPQPPGLNATAPRYPNTFAPSPSMPSSSAPTTSLVGPSPAMPIMPPVTSPAAPPTIAQAPDPVAPPSRSTTEAVEDPTPSRATPLAAKQRASLTPVEIKAEQTRLLTLLRSLHPMLVVDQICKALAYFGGIPGASAPTDGAFPESASSNGPGSLLIEWISEIFPHVEGTGDQDSSQTLAPIPAVGSAGASSANALSIPVKRGRGRPKGSKGSKKKDKMKDGILRNNDGTPLGPGQYDNPSVGHAMQANQVSDSSRLSINDVHGVQYQGQSNTMGPAMLTDQAGPGSSITTPGTRKRGRPKGSKNKPKPRPASSDMAEAINNSIMSQHSLLDSPLAHKTSTDRPGQGNVTSEAGVGTGIHAAVEASQIHAGDRFMYSLDTPTSTAHDPQLSQSTAPGNPTIINTSSSRKRKNQRPSQPGHQEPPEISNGFQTSSSIIDQTSSSQAQQSKRRRVSKDMIQNPSLSNIDSHTTGTDSLSSPNLSSGRQPTSPSRRIRDNLNQMIQEELQLQQRHQQQSPNPDAQRSNQTRGSAPTPEAFLRQQHQDQFQQKRQMFNQYMQRNNSGDRFARNMNSNQFQHNMMNSSPNLNNPPPGPPPLQPQPQQPQPQSSQPQHQPQSTGSSHPMTSFPGYSDPNYLEMEYSGGPANFGGHGQLEATMAEPNMRDRLYHALGRR